MTETLSDYHHQQVGHFNFYFLVFPGPGNYMAPSEFGQYESRKTRDFEECLLQREKKTDTVRGMKGSKSSTNFHRKSVSMVPGKGKMIKK
jgi:hypothetical protein